MASIKHVGAINRVKHKTLGATTVAAAWAETGSVGIWDGITVDKATMLRGFVD